MDMTQKEVAAKLGVSRGTIGMYETGKRNPDTETIIRLTKIFGVTADYLIGISNVRNPYKKKDSSDSHDINTPQDEYFTMNELRKFIKKQKK
jgi:transcriptional regulator with XRE-family HTH domain